MSGSNWRAEQTVLVAVAKELTRAFPGVSIVDAAKAMTADDLNGVTGPVDLLRRLADKIDPPPPPVPAKKAAARSRKKAA